MRHMEPHEVDYAELLKKGPNGDVADVIAFLLEELPWVWRDAYVASTKRATNICRLYHGEFRYIYDHYSELEKKQRVAYSAVIEDRVVAVYGLSHPTAESRDTAALRGWLGQTERVFDKRTDKGHLIAHTIGGGLAVNVFPQRRDVNRGWRGGRGTVFASMETYCRLHPGTFCFNRPLYSDDRSSRPAEFEFGVLKNAASLWVERFQNR